MPLRNVKKMIVLENLIQDIEMRKGKLDERLKNVSFKRVLNIFRKSIRQEANTHSCRLEQAYGKFGTRTELQNGNGFNEYYARLKKKGKEGNTDAELEMMDKMDKERELSRKDKCSLRELFKECYANIRNAWKWGLANFTQDFDARFMIEIAKRIEPNKVDGYRRNGKMIVIGREISPPPYELVPLEMINLMANIQRAREYIKEGKISPVELAIVSHYHLARIHPFVDGNGRTARMMQNLILNNHGYPAAIIHKGDKMNYTLNLEGAHKGFYSRKNKEDFINKISDGERHFFNYLASRINTSIDLILDGAYRK